MTNYIREMSGKQYLKRLAENPTVIIPTGPVRSTARSFPWEAI